MGGAEEKLIQATSYVDWASVDLGPEHTQGFTAPWDYAVDAAIASASHPLAFPSVLLDRTPTATSTSREASEPA